MNETIEKTRTAIQYLLLEGLEVSVASVQHLLKEQGEVVQDEQVVPILQEEGGPLPEYQGFVGA